MPDNGTAFDVDGECQPRSPKNHLQRRAYDVNVEPRVIDNDILHDEISRQRFTGA